ncbi:MAG: 16S rRNA (adenine(1518)-N(6)/adenine(1519)-N(6))-dimethyltransferase RsmA [Rickettsiales bacterium]|jgi:16S rRNA (adenine1518-N6/adenine1519-N6)-dimethyltransferase|nr:16S rRNA (adenine(1518)-N(6)/adenine(1519)-N(6))-dimethyltransferase RsmA [Rickettsiales bacterium]
MLKASEIVKKYNLTCRKELGQNFLLQKGLLDRIVASAGDLGGSDLLEVGPGPGGLTRALLEKNPHRLIAVELDQRSIEALEAEIKPFFSNMEIIRGDALKIDENRLFADRFSVVANLPYNIGTALLLKWLENSAPRIDHLTLLLQREVVARIIANPGTREYGRLSVICQYLSDVKKCFDIPPGVFVPPPKVTSSLVRLVVRRDADFSLLPGLIKLVDGLFAKKRKTLLNNLKTLTPFPGEVLDRCNLDPNGRAEELPLENILRILHQLKWR